MPVGVEPASREVFSDDGAQARSGRFHAASIGRARDVIGLLDTNSAWKNEESIDGNTGYKTGSQTGHKRGHITGQG